ncbi:hypothetical protein [Streptomyces thioluteus]|uniref:hypothetical protein n=1 Tax=Streptomyces thioluteus TaxID=66431 RepID=UPI0031ECB7DF
MSKSKSLSGATRVVIAVSVAAAIGAATAGASQASTPPRRPTPRSRARSPWARSPSQERSAAHRSVTSRRDMDALSPYGKAGATQGQEGGPARPASTWASTRPQPPATRAA